MRLHHQNSCMSARSNAGISATSVPPWDFCFEANRSANTPWCRRMVNLSDVDVRCESLLMSARKSFIY